MTTAINKKTKNNKVISYAAITILALLSLIALKNTFAHIFSYQGYSQINHWNEGNTPAEENFTAAKSAINTAIALNSANPDYTEAKAMLCHWQDIVESKDNKACETTEAKLNLFREAIKQRPNWAYTWVNLTSAKAQAQQIDEEFKIAFNQAKELGQNLPDVRLQLLDAGLQAWKSLSKDQIKDLMEITEKGLILQTKQTSAVINKNQMMAMICAKLPGGVNSKYC